jgi:prophage regulatory protein
MKPNRIIRRTELQEITGVSVATLYRWINAGTFPGPVRLGPNSVGWRSSEVQEWLDSRERIDLPTATGAGRG